MNQNKFLIATNVFAVAFLGLLAFSNGRPGAFEVDPHPFRYYETADNDQSFENDAQFWHDKAAKELEKRKNLMTNKKAKNIILFLGDGMSGSTVTAARILQAERNNISLSQAEPLSFENFIVTGLSRTYCLDYYVADSACSATAYLCGCKGNVGTVGVTAAVKPKNAKASVDPNNRVHSFAYAAQKAGKATGFVTNTRVTHASPSGVYAHSAEREWESDAGMAAHDVNTTLYDDIAEQLILREPGINLNVIMGGGRSNLLPSKISSSSFLEKGNRLDNVNLIEEWIKNKANREPSDYKYVTTRDELLSMAKTPSFLLGLFAPEHMSYSYKRSNQEPSLEEMTENAIKVLKKAGGENGFFLFVEGGIIDISHHDNQAQCALDETIELSKAVAKALAMTDEEDTLILVTADHSHTMTINGYPLRKDSIVEFSGNGSDNFPYTTLSYANGPGYSERRDLEKDDTRKIDYKFPSGVPLEIETHGGEDVSVFASGPNAQLFSGSYEQSYIPHAMAYASGLYDKFAKKKKQ